MRLAAVGDVHGLQHLADLIRDLDVLPRPDLLLLAGDLTERNDGEAFDRVVRAIRSRVDCPTYAVFGNNEYHQDHAAYASRSGLRFLEEEALDLEVAGTRFRLVGSTGCLDRPTWWQRRHMPHLAHEYEARVASLDKLLDGDGFRILLTHYPPTHATMGEEKPEWRPELGSLRLERAVKARRVDLVIHGHVHKGIPYAEIAPHQTRVDEADSARRTPVYNVAYPVTHNVTVLDVPGKGFK